MKRILWFSRHIMTTEQMQDLARIFGEFELIQISKTINSAYELQAEIEEVDVVAIVAPINLQQQFLKIAGEKPVISCKSKRILTPSEDGGEDKATFVHDGWYRIRKIVVEIEDL